jgi:hypothetical protein
MGSQHAPKSSHKRPAAAGFGTFASVPETIVPAARAGDAGIIE